MQQIYMTHTRQCISNKRVFTKNDMVQRNGCKPCLILITEKLSSNPTTVLQSS